MRITVEPTDDQGARSSVESIQHKVVVEHPCDDMTIDQVTRLMASALLAYGFLSESVTEYLKEIKEGTL